MTKLNMTSDTPKPAETPAAAPVVVVPAEKPADPVAAPVVATPAK